MIDLNLKFAFAVNHDNNFEKKHFGDADKYLIYEYINEELKFVSEQINNSKAIDEETNHGSEKKGNAIINSLKENGVNVLVSKQFGGNIKMVNRHFIPVIIYVDNIEEIISVLLKHMKWIIDEINNKPDEYKLFTVKKSVLKSVIKKY